MDRSGIVLFSFSVVATILLHARALRVELDSLSFTVAILSKLIIPSEPTDHPIALYLSRKAYQLACWPNNFIHSKRNQVSVQVITISKCISQVDNTPSAPISVNIYTKDAPHTKLQDVIVWIHGGGFIFGDAGVDEAICHDFVLEADAVVVSVDYRLSPEFPFPVPVQDCSCALQWVSQHIEQFGGNPKKIFVAGESAGGSLAAVIAAVNLDPQFTPVEQRVSVIGVALAYPGTLCYVHCDSLKHDSIGGILRLATAVRCADLYSGGLGAALNADYRFAPLNTPSGLLAQFPPTTVVVAKYDILLDNGVQFANKLRENGVDVVLRQYDNTIHGFFGKRLFASGYDSLKVFTDRFRDISKRHV